MKKFDKKTLTNPVLIAVLATLACALWGSAYPAIKIGYASFHIADKDIGAQILFAGYRFTLAGILTFIIGSILEKRILIPKKDSIPGILSLGLVQTTIQYIFFYVGMSNATGVKGSIISASNSFFTILLAHFLIKTEKLTSKKILGCILGFMGVIIINFTTDTMSSSFSMMGEGLLTLAAFAYAAGSLITKFISKKDTPMVITSTQLLFGGIVLIITGIAMGGQLEGFNLYTTGLLIYMALISTGAFSLWTLLLKYNPVGKVAIYGFMIPIFGVLQSAIFLGENIFSPRKILALVLVCAGIVVVNKNGKQESFQ